MQSTGLQSESFSVRAGTDVIVGKNGEIHAEEGLRDEGSERGRKKKKRWVRYKIDLGGENTRKNAINFSDCTNESAREMRKNKYNHTTVLTLGV